jgi:short-subunit dehydrogenase
VRLRSFSGLDQGLGWALTRRFVAENVRVGAVARDEAQLNAPIRSQGSNDVRPYVADVSNSEDVFRVFDSVSWNTVDPIVYAGFGEFMFDETHRHL